MSKNSFLLFVIILMIPVTVSAQSAAEKGYQILKKAAESSSGYRSSSSDGEMILRSADGQTSFRKFYVKGIEGSGGRGGKNLLVFEWPGDIRNTGLLTHSNSRGSDNQWLFLPSISRVKKISSTGRSGAFVGSEFAFEDMVDQDLDKFTYNWVEQGSCPAGGVCDVVDRFPKYSSGYSKQRVWVDTNHSLIQQVQYFNRGNSHLKTLSVTAYKKFNGKFWRAGRLLMKNHQSGKQTSLAWSNRKFGIRISPSELSVNGLKRLK
jgi:outer membrane lipoprotein-sorting protein